MHLPTQKMWPNYDRRKGGLTIHHNSDLQHSSIIYLFVTISSIILTKFKSGEKPWAN
jgi:hypothetical protein